MIKTSKRRWIVKVSNPALEQFRADVMRGLRGPGRTLPCKYFYDTAGSDLFERITTLEEYYPTRTEMGIMREYGAELAELLGPRAFLIEYGSGSSAKTRILLDHLHEPAGYMPIDVSQAYLKSSAQALAQQYPDLLVLPRCADFTRRIVAPELRPPPARRVVYFPGSTIGNFTPAETIGLLRNTAALCGPGGALLLGADLEKDPHVLEAAYNDARGVTAAFNLNILARINRELGGNFVLDQFAHRAFYNRAEHRIEMHLVSKRDQHACIGKVEFFFPAGTSICTEYSYKFSLGGLRELASAAGFTIERIWMDDRRYFSVNYLAIR